MESTDPKLRRYAMLNRFTFAYQQASVFVAASAGMSSALAFSDGEVTLPSSALILIFGGGSVVFAAFLVAVLLVPGDEFFIIRASK
jgi:hypothetical protein